MSDIPVRNDTAMPIWVGGTMIPAGETRMFPEHQVPPHLHSLPAPARAAPEAPRIDAVLALLDLKVDDIVEQLEGLSAEDLARLKAAEEAGKTRKTLMAAIGEEELRRAHQAEIRKQLERFDDVRLENYFNDLPDGAEDREVAATLMRERGLGAPGIQARLEQLDDAALRAHRAAVLDNETELAIVDEMMAARGLDTDTE